MRLKIHVPKDAKHDDVVSCVAWASADELLLGSDDHTISKIDLLTSESTAVYKLSKDFCPVDMSCRSNVNVPGKGGKAQSNLFVVTSSDGKFHLLQGGRIEKTVDAHRGAVLSGRWSYDASALVTAGEDGKIKIWSRSGMLRSTLVQIPVCIYCAAWSPESDKIVYTHGKTLIIQPLQPSAKESKWKAHDGIVLKVDWNLVNNLIVSGGEDCKYKVWDNYGRLLFSSSPAGYPMTSIAWSPDGEMFAVGSFNSIQLCDKSGWSHGQEKLEYGSLLNIDWSADGTQLAAACAGGHIITAHCVDKRLEWCEFEVVLVSRKTIEVKNISNDAKEVLEMRDRVIKLSMGYDYLIIITSMQCLIYRTNNFNTPTMFDLRSSSVSLIKQCERCFVLVDSTALFVYSYEGRHISSPKLPNTVQTYTLNSNTLSLSSDVMALRDGQNEKCIHLIDTNSGRPWEDGAPINHDLQVIQVCLSQAGEVSDRFVVLIDKNKDVYITPAHKNQASFQLKKLAAMVQSLQWNSTLNTLCGLRDTQLLVWYYPTTVFIDVNILSLTLHEQDCGDLGKNLMLLDFHGSTVSLRRADGSNVFVSISPYPQVLHRMVGNSRWDEAIRLCRFAKEAPLWACLAAMALRNKEFTTAEIAYAAIQEVDKVEYLHNIKETANPEVRAAKMALFCGNWSDAELKLLRAGFTFLVIQLNMDLYQWERALDLAIKHKTHIDTVLGFRQLYLQQMGKKETNDKFKQLSKGVDIEWDKIQTKVQAELDSAGSLN